MTNLPLLSACTVLKDEEIYNSIDEENSLDNGELLFNDELGVFVNNNNGASDETAQSGKSRNASDKTRFDSKLLNAWLQDVNDKWMKVKRDILLRQRREAESLQAIQRLNWSWRGKDLDFYDGKTNTANVIVDDAYVPIVKVDDFHLFPITHFQ